MKKKDIEKPQQQDSHHLHLALHSVAVPTLSDVFKVTEYSRSKESNKEFISK